MVEIGYAHIHAGMALYLEDVDSVTIGEIMGLSPGNVRTQIHRIKSILAKRFHSGGKP